MYIDASYQFLENLRIVQNASLHTIRSYAIDLNCFKAFLENEWVPHMQKEHLPEKISYILPYPQRKNDFDDTLNLSRINRKIICKYLAHLIKNKKSKKTVSRRLSSLRSFFKFTLKHHLTHEDPTEEIDNPKIERSLPSSISYDQICYFFEQPDITTYFGLRDRAMMELFYSSGLRASELIGLNRNDVDLKELTIKLRGKGKKERLIPITLNASKWIKRYIEHPESINISFEGPLFCNKFGTRLTTRSLNRFFVSYLKKSGLSGNITPHVLRHTIATHWLENGMDLKTIQAILGHSALSTTTIYTNVSTRLKKKIYDQTHPRA